MFLAESFDTNENQNTPQLSLDTLGLSQEISSDIQQKWQQQVQQIQKNKNYLKKEGGGAQYENQEIDLNGLQIEKLQKQISSDSVQLPNPQFDVPQILGIPSTEFPILSNQVSQQQPCARDKINYDEDNQDQQQQEQIIAPIYGLLSVEDLIPQAPFSPYQEKITNIKLPEYLKNFLINPIPEEGMFQCQITRDKSGLNRFTPKYKMYWSHNHQFLIAARKVLNRKKYIFTQDSEFKQKDEVLLLGKMQLNENSKSEYLIYDNGAKKQDTSIFKKPRKLCAVVFFDTTYECNSKPRKIEMIYHQENLSTHFVSRKPQTIKKDQKILYTLDFFGRVKLPSVKNFQLVKKNDSKDLIYIQFGKINKNMYNLDFMAPLSPLIAFQIALTAFDFKRKE